MTNDDGRKPEGAPERSAKAGAGAPSGVDGNGPKRFSVQRKMAIVARLLRGEVALELAEMKALPKFKTTDFTLVSTTVTSSGTIRVRGVLYTVPSRLVGTRLKVHIYDDRLVCFLGATEVLRLRRIRRGCASCQPKGSSCCCG
jgi:hypothetical protein